MKSIYPLIVVVLLLASSVNATNYYFSASTGNDSLTTLQAEHPGTPWKSLNKLNQFFNSLQPGDSVLFKRGDTFSGFVNISKSGTPTLPIVFSTYGTGAKPIINGLTQLTGWKSIGSNLWQSPCSS